MSFRGLELHKVLKISLALSWREKEKATKL